MSTAAYKKARALHENGTDVLPLSGVFDAACETVSSTLCEVTICRTSNFTRKDRDVEVECSVTGVTVLLALFAFLAFVIIVGNALIVYVTMARKGTKKPYNCFKCSLAVSDFLQGAIAIPASAYSHTHLYFSLGQNNYSKSRNAGMDFLNVYKVYIFCFLLSNILSLFNLVMLSLDRFLAIRFPLRYRTGAVMNRTRVYSGVAFTWLIGIGLSVAFEELLTTKMRSAEKDKKRYVDKIIQATSIIFASCYVVIIILLGSTVRTSLLAMRQMQALNASATKGKNSDDQSRENRFVLTVAVMTVAFSISVAPYAVLMMSKVQASSQVELFFESLLYTNSLWNVVIYSARCDDFQLAMRSLPGTRILMRCFCQRKVEKEEKYTPVTTMVTTSLTVTEQQASTQHGRYAAKSRALIQPKKSTVR